MTRNLPVGLASDADAFAYVYVLDKFSYPFDYLIILIRKVSVGRIYS